MSDLLSIGASGVRAYQSAMTTVSENIANVGTTGYARRSTDLSEISAAESFRTRSVLSGQGVSINGISRAADPFRSAEVRSAQSDLSRTSTGVATLERIDSSLTDYQLSDRLTAFFAAAKSVAADPSATGPRAAMLESAQGVASAFAGSGRALDAAANEIDTHAKQSLDQLNQLTGALAKVNSSLGRTAADNSGHAQLLDERDRILESMSKITDISVDIDTAGRASVRGGGSAGPMLVQGDIASTVSYSRNATGAVSLAVSRLGTTSALTPTGGELAGIVDGAQRIAAASEQLDTIAKDFVDGINAVQAGGNDLSGNPGAAMFAMSGGASTMTMPMTDPGAIAAAGPSGGARDNSNVANLDAFRTSGNIENRITDLVTDNASALSGRRAVSDVQTAIKDKATAARDSVAGVNLDEEAVDLLRFQQAYQASSRVIQVARESLQSLLNIG
ncbi:flagellar hook-associated protein FlgK [Stakelama marina]|uniref:Flagellar hook-associated protein 1 n=1 Tax=Stakelama marina TaxID=2826939 RepID=A0A8T4IDL6_9SPHN|nr:flagellar hook-associated protein FlgK [Stakelama marina]MBR0553108.1 flagellar hook-associated protein FlgK [Stakelama marina]